MAAADTHACRQRRQQCEQCLTQRQGACLTRAGHAAFAPGRMLGVVTAMETFCGQAHGARRYQMVR